MPRRRCSNRPTCPALINVFFLAERNRKDAGVDRRELTAATIRNVGVVGAGVMGCSIAAVNLQRRLPVVISDAASDALARSEQQVLGEAAWDEDLGAADAGCLAELKPLLRPASSELDYRRL